MTLKFDTAKWAESGLGLSKALAKVGVKAKPVAATGSSRGETERKAARTLESLSLGALLYYALMGEGAAS